jgi:hypothetical protein
MQEQTVIVDGKEVKASEMPKDCFLFYGKCYTEKGLPKELNAYKHLWKEAKEAKQLGNTAEKGKREEPKKTTVAPTEQAPDPVNTAKHVNTTPEKQ